MKRIALILIILSGIIFQAASATHGIIQQADSAYNKEDYASASRLYNKYLQEVGQSPTVLYNLANTYYRMGSIGRAIINYERALRLDPSFTDARTNLDYVNSKILDKPEDDSSFLENLYDSIIAMSTPNTWAWTALGCFILLLVAIALYIFARKVGIRKLGFFGAIIMSFVTVFTLTLAANSASGNNEHDYAIEMVPTTNLTSAPRAPKGKEEKVVPIHEGTRLKIVDSVPTPDDASSHMYYDVKINNSTRAWVKATDVERI